MKSGSCTIMWIVGQAKWTTTNNTKGQSSSKKLCRWWDWKEVLCYELLLSNQMINFNKYCSQLDQLKTALDEEHLELVNRKCIIFHQDNARLHVSLMNRQKLTAWLGSSVSSAVLHLRISIYFSLYKFIFSFFKGWKFAKKFILFTEKIISNIQIYYS